MSKRHGRRGPQEGAPVGSPAAQSPRPQGARPPGSQPHRGPQPPQKTGTNWVQLRDSIRRDLEVAIQSLAFLERFGDGLDSQRRLFVDFPRVTEELRTGAMERLAAAMERLYEGGGPQALDLNRFLRDLPLALGHLASAELAARRQAQQAASAKLAREKAAAGGNSSSEEKSAGAGSASANAAGEGTSAALATEAAPDAAPIEGSAPDAADTVAQEGNDEAPEAAEAAEEATAEAVAESSGAATSAAASDSPPAEAAKDAGAKPEPVSPRVELRSRLLAAAPQLNKAAQSFRRNTATVRRAASPRRAVGPWRSDHEVLEQARRAIEFASKIYDTYAEAWADAPLAKNAGSEAAAEMDRFLAWTQLSRYAEVARTQSTISQPKQHEAAPGVKSDKPQEPGAHSPSAPPPTEPPREVGDQPAPAELGTDATAAADGF